MYTDAMEPNSEPSDLPWKERVCKSDSKKFMKYIQSTPTHGVAHVFTGKSTIRRLFWLFIVLAAAGSCLFNVIDRFQFLLSSPTSTTTSLERRERLEFPAVTICNLNTIKRSYIDALQSAGINVSALTDFDLAKCDTLAATDAHSNLNLTNIILEGGYTAEEFILECYFMGRTCNLADSFTRVVTRLGVCYAFNSDSANISISSAPGPRFGLQLVLNIGQEENTDTLNNDAGVTVVIHSQNEPPEPTDSGLTVPPGHAARIGLTKKIVCDDSTATSCRHSHTANFTFLPDTFDYTMPACLAEAYFTEIVRECGCIDGSVLVRPTTGPFSSLPDCGVSHLCCSYDVFATSPPSGCVPACQYASYSTTISYSAFPAEFTSTTEQLLAQTNMTREEMSRNLLSVNVFFQHFNIERQTTRDAYQVTALLSDIGGQLGLFLGASVVSMLEFLLWVMDELKDRCVGVNDKKLARWLRRRITQCRRWEKEAQAQLDSLEMSKVQTNR